MTATKQFLELIKEKEKKLEIGNLRKDLYEKLFAEGFNSLDEEEIRKEGEHNLYIDLDYFKFIIYIRKFDIKIIYDYRLKNGCLSFNDASGSAIILYYVDSPLKEVCPRLETLDVIYEKILKKFTEILSDSCVF